MEARVYAEDPQRNFLPSIGRLTRFIPPPDDQDLRVDTGVTEGDEVSIYYDPMVAKVIAYGDDRTSAISRLQQALDRFYIGGIRNNLDFLSALVGLPDFQKGQFTTELIKQRYPDGFDATRIAHQEPATLYIIAAVLHRRYRQRASQISGQLPGYQPNIDETWTVLHQGNCIEVAVRESDSGEEVQLGDTTYYVESDWQFGQPIFDGTIDRSQVYAKVERMNLGYRLSQAGTQADLVVLSSSAAELLRKMPAKSAPDTSRILRSPMPGLLTQLIVSQGESVQVGQEMAIVEAMKMENVLRSEKAGIVSTVLAEVGDTLAVDQPIFEIE